MFKFAFYLIYEFGNVWKQKKLLPKSKIMRVSKIVHLILPLVKANHCSNRAQSHATHAPECLRTRCNWTNMLNECIPNRLTFKNSHVWYAIKHFRDQITWEFTKGPYMARSASSVMSATTKQLGIHICNDTKFRNTQRPPVEHFSAEHVGNITSIRRICACTWKLCTNRENTLAQNAHWEWEHPLQATCRNTWGVCMVNRTNFNQLRVHRQVTDLISRNLTHFPYISTWQFIVTFTYYNST